DLRSQRLHRQVIARHGDHDFESAQSVARVVRVDGRHRSFVTGVHGLEHVQRLARTHFTDDDAIGTHTQTVLHQIALRDFALAFHVGRTGYEAHELRLL